MTIKQLSKQTSDALTEWRQARVALTNAQNAFNVAMPPVALTPDGMPTPEARRRQLAVEQRHADIIASARQRVEAAASKVMDNADTLLDAAKAQQLDSAGYEKLLGLFLSCRDSAPLQEELMWGGLAALDWLGRPERRELVEA